MKILVFCLSLIALNINNAFPSIIKQELITFKQIDTTNNNFNDSLFKSYIKLLEKSIEYTDFGKYYKGSDLQEAIKYVSLVTGIESETPRSGTLGGRYYISERDLTRWKTWYNNNVKQYYKLSKE